MSQPVRVDGGGASRLARVVRIGDVISAHAPARVRDIRESIAKQDVARSCSAGGETSTPGLSGVRPIDHREAIESVGDVGQRAADGHRLDDPGALVLADHLWLRRRVQIET